MNIFSEEASKVIRCFQDIGLFLLSPRRYINIVVDENTKDSIHRFCIHAICFTVLELVVFRVAIAKAAEISTYEILGVAIFETVISLFLFPTFLLVAYLTRSHKPIKTAVVYALTGRFVFLVPTFLLYGFFLLTEDYTFALLRGVSAYAFGLAHVLVLPFALSRTLRGRALAISVGLISSILSFILLGLLFFQTSTQASKVIELSVLYDPIGAEVEDLKIGFDIVGEQSPIGSLFRSLRSLREDDQPENARSNVRQQLAGWSQIRDQSKLKWEKERTHLQEKRNAARFSTTRQLIDLRLEEMQVGEDVVRAIDSFLASPSVDSANVMFDEYGRAQTATINGLKLQSEHLGIRVKLLEAGLLIN